MHLKKTTFVLLAATLALGLAACKKKGSAEKAGEKIDNPSEEIGTEIKDATQ